MSLHATSKPRWMVLLHASCALVAGLLLVSCGQVSRAELASPTTPATAPAAQSTRGNVVAVGCPVQRAPSDANSFHPDVTITSSQDLGAAQPVALTQGQRLEIHLESTVQWSLTTTGPAHVLDSMTPAGWYDASLNACVWRFTAVGAGTDHLAFRGPVLCPPNIRCTAVLEQVAFDVTVR